MTKDIKVSYPHPGEILLKEFMQPLGLSGYAMAKALHVSPITISLILRGKRNISPEMAMRLGRWSHCPADFWLGLQAEYDCRQAEKKLSLKINREVTPCASLATV